MYYNMIPHTILHNILKELKVPNATHTSKYNNANKYNMYDIVISYILNLIALLYFNVYVALGTRFDF